MIENARVLQPEFVPREVQHRDAETRQLAHALDPLIDGEHADPSLLTGPSGVGKTCIAQFAVERLQENTLDVESEYVNCWEHYSRFKALHAILSGVEPTLDIHRQSTPTDVLLDRIRAYDGAPYVVILDEVDQLQDKALLYDLYRISNLELVLIANKETDVLAGLDDRLGSRLSNAVRIHFDRYHVDELVSILEDRVRWGLGEDTISRDVLAFIADQAAGDARTALGTLRHAARTADRESYDRITHDLIVDAVPVAETEIKQASLETLKPHQRALYEILRDAGAVTPRDLYAEYQSAVEDPRTRRTVRNYLQKLEQYNLVESEGATRDRTYTALEP